MNEDGWIEIELLPHPGFRLMVGEVEDLLAPLASANCFLGARLGGLHLALGGR